LNHEDKKLLKAGEKVLLSGTVYTARDAAHKKIVEALANGAPLPFELQGSTIFYTGPTPAQADGLPGSAGPTTSSRMDAYTLPLLKNGVSAFIGKGARSDVVNKALLEHGVIYFAGIGGAGALLANAISSMKLIAYPELGPEAVYKFEIADLPVYVALDLNGGNIYGR
jgi:fumarate hydratase subunit beta